MFIADLLFGEEIKVQIYVFILNVRKNLRIFNIKVRNLSAT